MQVGIDLVDQDHSFSNDSCFAIHVFNQRGKVFGRCLQVAEDINRECQEAPVTVAKVEHGDLGTTHADEEDALGV